MFGAVLRCLANIVIRGLVDQRMEAALQALIRHTSMTILALIASTGIVAGQTFSQWSPFCDGVNHTAGIALGDLDGDGDLDIVFANGRHFAEPDWVFSNNGKGDFYARRALVNEPDRSYGVALGDLDGDGALDIVVANDTGNRSALYRNDGKGNFTFLRGLGSGREARRAVALGDLDKDGDLDVVLVGPEQDHIYINETGGRWTERLLGSGKDWSLSVALADLDGDGDLDIIVANRYQVHSLVYINDGRGGIAEKREIGTGREDTTSVSVGDVDGDNDLDIVTANWQQQHVVHRNDGRGYFRDSYLFGTGKELTWTVALGDMDLDRDLDIVVGNVAVSIKGVDLDGDGQPDRYVQENGGEPSRVYVNDGTGRLVPGSQFGAGNDNTRPIALGDVDRDGDLDIVIGNDCQPNNVFFNSLRGPKPKLQ
ncbi:MAG TPA: VCBS repeat-containing protein [Pyrinomonadaceae bacterium]|nr:VCBS repeat-containing protein [Pyrinomonadaceae bacterium]